ncbi:MAG: hypothetical protein ACJ72O_00670 [Marmoricola sp.]
MTVVLLRRALPVSLLVLALTSCGDQGTQDRPRAADPATPTPVAADVQVTCGRSVSWPASAMSERTAKSESRDLVPALEKLAGSAGMDAPPAFQESPVEDADWFELARTDDAAAVATGAWDASGPGKRAQVVYLEREGTGWKATGWGDCQLEPVLPDREQWVQIDEVSSGRDSADLRLLVHETSCTSGRDPRPYLHDPTVVETPTRVTVSWSSEAPGDGAYNCIGNHPVPATVHLTAPLGGRDLYDGSSWPARKVG